MNSDTAFANPVVILKLFGRPVFTGDVTTIAAVIEEAWQTYGQYGLPVDANPEALSEDPRERRCQIGGLVALALDQTDPETQQRFCALWPEIGFDLEADIVLGDDGEWALQPALIRRPDKVH